MEQEQSNKNDWGWVLLISLAGLLLRLPYWETIPASFDEVNQTSFAYQIAQAQAFPLVANDAYTGPFYVYLLGAIQWFGVSNPMLGRIIVMITGVLTIPLTYGWVKQLGRGRQHPQLATWAAPIAAGLVAVNPDLILVNSHIGGATFMLPFFIIAFLFFITLAARKDSIGQLLWGVVAAGLALHSNPIAGLAIAGGLLWFLGKTKSLSILGKRWPIWPVLAGLLILAVYSPVITYNLTTDFDTLDVLEDRSYLWEDNPTLETTRNNLRRFTFQTTRQVSGVVQGDETFRSLLGLPLIFLMFMVGGLFYSTRRVSTLPLAVLLPYAIVLPIFSSHYGFISVGRFTTLLVPVWIAVISLGVASLVFVSTPRGSQTKVRLFYLGSIALVGILGIFSVFQLFEYYGTINRSHASGAPLLELSRYAAENNQGEPIYISDINEFDNVGIPYVPRATFLLADIHHEFLPASQILGRLYARPEAAYLLLTDEDHDWLSSIAPLTSVEDPANMEAFWQNFGLYRFEGNSDIPKPDFVLSPAEVPSDLSDRVVFADNVQLLGCHHLEESAAPTQLLVECYWEILNEMPPAEYVGFAHLFDPQAGRLVAQDDHVLGKELYPLNAWQPGEVVKEGYMINIAADAPLDQYQLFIGIYTWPELKRLSVDNDPNNVAIVPLP